MTSVDRIAAGDMVRPGALREERLALLAAIIATDERPTLVFSAEGEILLGNPALASGMVGRWRDFSASVAWVEHCRAARRSGKVRVARPLAGSGELAVLPGLRASDGELFLLRLDPQLDAMDRKAGELATLAHDLRVPLQTLLLSSPSGAGGHADAAGLALEHIGKLLEVYRMDRLPGSAEPEEVFELTGLLRDLGRVLQPICDSRGIRLDLDLPDAPLWLVGRSHLVRAVAQNLLGNAAQAQGVRRISVALEPAPGAGALRRRVRLRITDDGPGLPQDIKDLFGSGSGVLPDPGQRPGLGLKIVWRALARLGAGTEVSSSAAGTEFRIEFEMPVAEAPQDSAAPPPDPVRLDGLRILVVEDNPINLAILMQSLSDAGAVVEGVTTGREACDLLLSPEAALPDLVFMDVTLPDIDGIEVTRSCLAQGAAVPVVGLTAHDDPVVHAAGLGAGMTRVLVKPVLPSLLRRAAAEVAAGRSGQRLERPAAREDAVMLGAAQVSELVEEMGRPAALAFMSRALAESEEVLARTRETGLDADRRRDIHSAIGSAGLTGLNGVELALRQLQEAARDARPADPACGLLEQRIAQTRRILVGMSAE